MVSYPYCGGADSAPIFRWLFQALAADTPVSRRLASRGTRRRHNPTTGGLPCANLSGPNHRHDTGTSRAAMAILNARAWRGWSIRNAAQRSARRRPGGGRRIVHRPKIQSSGGNRPCADGADEQRDPPTCATTLLGIQPTERRSPGGRSIGRCAGRRVSPRAAPRWRPAIVSHRPLGRLNRSSKTAAPPDSREQEAQSSRRPATARSRTSATRISAFDRTNPKISRPMRPQEMLFGPIG